MQLLDGEIAALLEEQNTDLFTKSWQAQAAFEHVLRIGREVDVETAPPGCAPLPSRGTRLLPTTCPKCGTPVRADALEWVDGFLLGRYRAFLRSAYQQREETTSRNAGLKVFYPLRRRVSRIMTFLP